MNLSDLTDPNAVLAAVEEFNRLGRDEFLGKYGFGKAQNFFLVRDGKYYDSKAIAGVALGYQYPENGPLTSKDFSGGEDTVVRKFEELGFNVEKLPSFIEILRRILELQSNWSKDATSDMKERGELIRVVGPKVLKTLLPSLNLSFEPLIEGRDGTGSKNRVPWIRVFDRMHSPSATIGWYVVFLFSSDGKAVYLSLNQGTTTNVRGSFKNRDESVLKERVEWAREKIRTPSLMDRVSTSIDLKDSGGKGEQYELGNVYAFGYEKDSLPRESIVIQDLTTMLRMLDQLYKAESKEMQSDIEQELDELPTKTSFDESILTNYEDIFLAASAAEGHIEDLESLWSLFIEFIRTSGLELDNTTAIDVLAAVLSSQFLLFAGPSGTGKSSTSRTLARFFTKDDAWSILEARRQWIGIEDAFGYYSHINNSYCMTPNTIDLLGLHRSTLTWFKERNPITPILVIEEANLSPIEGYLAPIIHGMSVPSAPCIKVQLYAKYQEIDKSEEISSVPKDVFLGPFPRFFGTINVDPNSPAPARKVSSRACVILLEPEAHFDATLATNFLCSLDSIDTSVDALAESGQGCKWLGNPSLARMLASETTIQDCTEALASLLEKINRGRIDSLVHISRRDLIRCVNYMTYFLRLGEVAFSELEHDTLLNYAAENALLHIVLPNLSAYSFRECTEALLQDNILNQASQDSKALGGLLLPRLARLQSSTKGLVFAEALDFWTCLS